MIKVKFIGESDDFFENGQIYAIEKTWIAPYSGFYSIDTVGCYIVQYIWVKFRKIKEYCACCGKPIADIDPSKRDYIEIPYSSLRAFLRDWEIIYE